MREHARQRVLRLSPAGRRDAGTTSLELAFVAPALLLLVFTGIQVGLWFYGRTVALQAAREGVSQLRLVGNRAEAEAIRGVVEERVAGFARTVGRESLLDPRVESRWYLMPDGNARVEVVVHGEVVSLVPGLDLRTTQRVSGEVERFEGSVEVAP